MRAITSAAVLLSVAMQPSSSQAPLRLMRAIDLPHLDGRIGHLAFGPSRQRLFVAALGNNTVEVVEVKSGTPVKSLPGSREPQGIAVVADAGLVAIANGQG